MTHSTNYEHYSPCVLSFSFSFLLTSPPILRSSLVAIPISCLLRLAPVGSLSSGPPSTLSIGPAVRNPVRLMSDPAVPRPVLQSALSSSSANAAAGPSKPQRSVRVFARLPQDDDSSSEGEERADGPQDGPDGALGFLSLPLFMLIPSGVEPTSRHASYSGSTGSPSARLNPSASSSAIHTRSSRSMTAGTSSTGLALSTPSAAIAPPPSADLGPARFQDWQRKFRTGQPGSSRSGSFGKPKPDGSSAASRRRGVFDIVDPDSNYFEAARRPHRLDDWNSDEDEDALRTAAPDTMATTPLPTAPASAFAPDSGEGKERLEWQSMLASVLSGDILQGESSRIGVDRPGDEIFRKRLGQSLWWQIRARMRGRSEDEEKRRVEERRGRVVDAVLEEVESFGVKPTVRRHPERSLSSETQPKDVPETDGTDEPSALDQVAYILQKMSIVESLYPHQAALRSAKPLYDSEAFQARIDALTSWFTLVTALQAQLQVLQKWTGSDDLDVTRPNTTKEKALVGKNRYHQDNKAKLQTTSTAYDQAADDSTFLERVMKEDNIQRTFEKRVFVDLLALIHNAKETVVAHLPIFQQLQLPDFQYELVRLIGFPGRLIIEALKVRLDAAAKLVDPNPMVINDMIDNFRLAISLAVLIKRQYEEIAAPDEDRRWSIPYCLAPDYDAAVLGGLRTFFKLLHWKLKSGSKANYFRETEVLEDEWEFLYEAAEAVEGGDLVVAEHFWQVLGIGLR